MQIFKLAQGEYVAVERVEANYKKLAVIQQIFAYGNSMESMLVAVIVPEESLLVDSAKANNIPFSSYSELLAKEETKSMLLKQMDGVAKECKMKVSTFAHRRRERRSRALKTPPCCIQYRLAVSGF